MLEIRLIKLSPTENEILNYLNTYAFQGQWNSPTVIGAALYYDFGSNRNSAWASHKCLALVKKGLLERNYKGWYRVKKGK